MLGKTRTQIFDMKVNGRTSEICSGAEEFEPMLKEILRLKYDEKPDYEHLRSLLLEQKVKYVKKNLNAFTEVYVSDEDKHIGSSEEFETNDCAWNKVNDTYNLKTNQTQPQNMLSKLLQTTRF